MVKVLEFTESDFHRVENVGAAALIIGLGLYYLAFKEMPLFVNVLAG